jgi:hypothetical protein
MTTRRELLNRAAPLALSSTARGDEAAHRQPRRLRLLAPPILFTGWAIDATAPRPWHHCALAIWDPNAAPPPANGNVLRRCQAAAPRGAPSQPTPLRGGRSMPPGRPSDPIQSAAPPANGYMLQTCQAAAPRGAPNQPTPLRGGRSMPPVLDLGTTTPGRSMPPVLDLGTTTPGRSMPPVLDLGITTLGRGAPPVHDLGTTTLGRPMPPVCAIATPTLGRPRQPRH